MQAYHNFMSYNFFRLKLEADLTSRIDVVDSLLLDAKIGKQCKAFYRNQKKELRSALNEPNALKSYKLKLYSEDCPHTESQDSWESEEDTAICCIWPHIFPLNRMKLNENNLQIPERKSIKVLE
ncbi:uncharacterized protein Dvir_GJ26177 [Drosophila virilis]|uniref:Uncharacterized protein n=2 Tax=Drosophila virilis TaxID=7244 RepID=A0A0Q9W8T7_DROVI|nr:uncharacterized protein Dvir_GJ26177 [Drosophila virilis]